MTWRQPGSFGINNNNNSLKPDPFSDDCVSQADKQHCMSQAIKGQDKILGQSFKYVSLNEAKYFQAQVHTSIKVPEEESINTEIR